MAFEWYRPKDLTSKTFRCGHCGQGVASSKGYFSEPAGLLIYICPHCKLPSFFDNKTQIPGVAPGNNVDHLPEAIEALYKEARICISVGAHTSSVLSCRKLLMNIAVEKRAKTGESFLYYVEYLAENGFVPPNGKGWVDHIRKKGNEATHEIALMEKEDAEDLIVFAEMLLKFIFEFPQRIPQPNP